MSERVSLQCWHNGEANGMMRDGMIVDHSMQQEFLSMAKPTINILVVFYSFAGHTAQLAKHIAKGSASVDSVRVDVKQVPELLPDSFFAKNEALQEARREFANIPIATISDLIKADGVAFGTPVHFGSFASQLKQFIDQLSPVFTKGTLLNKPAALFTSSGSTHGGEEVALLSLMVPLLNLGMLPIGVPYPVQGAGPEFDAGSPYGAIFVSGHKGEKKLSDGDAKVAQLLGRRLAAVTKVMKRGIDACPDCAFLAQQYD